MFDGVTVHVADAGEPQQGILIADDGIHHLADHGVGTLQVDLLSESGVRHEAAHDADRFRVNPLRVDTLVGQ